MADQTQADQNAGGQAQQSPMPSEEQNANDASRVVEAAAEGAPQVTNTTNTDDLSLSSDASERTATQFEKLKDQLAEERRARERLEQAFSFQAQQLKEDVSPLYDPETGYVDASKLEQMRSTVTATERRAIQAEQKFEKYIQSQQEQEAFAAHPELNPDAKNHDKDLHNLTRAILTDSIMNPNDYGGQELTAKAAADLAKKQRSKVIEQVRKEAATEAVEQLTPKEQASLEATGRSDRRVDTRDYADLVDRTRRNDYGAIMERLANIPSVAGG